MIVCVPTPGAAEGVWHVVRDRRIVAMQLTRDEASMVRTLLQMMADAAADPSREVVINVVDRRGVAGGLHDWTPPAEPTVGEYRRQR